MNAPEYTVDFDKEMGRGLRYEDATGVLRFEWDLAKQDRTIALLVNRPLDGQGRDLPRNSLEPVWFCLAIERVKQFAESRGWSVDLVE